MELPDNAAAETRAAFGPAIGEAYPSRGLRKGDNAAENGLVGRERGDAEESTGLRLVEIPIHPRKENAAFLEEIARETPAVQEEKRFLRRLRFATTDREHFIRAVLE